MNTKVQRRLEHKAKIYAKCQETLNSEWLSDKYSEAFSDRSKAADDFRLELAKHGSSDVACAKLAIPLLRSYCEARYIEFYRLLDEACI